MPNTQANNLAENQVFTGWAYIQTWSSNWGPVLAAQISSLASWVQGFYK